jgi:hypothetical protein
MEKINHLKLKIPNIIIVLFLILSGCAVPFQNAETLEKGEKEGTFGYTPINNITIKAAWGLTGYTDIAIGCDLCLPIPLPSPGYISAKQKLLSLDLTGNAHLNILVSGSIGTVITNNECPSYYDYNVLVGFKGGSALLTLGGGMLKHPWYSYDFMSNSFSDEVCKQFFIGLRGEKTMMQIQIIFDREKGNFANVGFAILRGR